MRTILSTLLLLLLTATASAQFQGFFEHMFGGQGGQQQQRAQDVPSDSNWYRQNYDNARCQNYLCPDTLACVSVPEHCPCAFPDQEDKVELGSGARVCASKGGHRADALARKMELLRRGVL